MSTTPSASGPAYTLTLDMCRRISKVRSDKLTPQQKLLLDAYVQEITNHYGLSKRDVRMRFMFFDESICRRFIGRDVWSIPGIAYLHMALHHKAYDFGCWWREIEKTLYPNGEVSPIYAFMLEDTGVRLWCKYMPGLVDSNIRNSLLTSKKTDLSVFASSLERCFALPSEDVKKDY